MREAALFVILIVSGEASLSESGEREALMVYGGKKCTVLLILILVAA
jgi:hypothetical protein